ncbi:MAG: methyltransferase, partial [Pseudomonadota bacterium]
TFKFGGFSHLVDVGGGKGAFASAVGARYPSLRLSVLDLPAVVARIPDDANIQAIGGSFLETAIPESADIVSLVRILHDHDDETVLGLLSNLRRNIGENATLVIAEPMAETRGAEVVGHAYFGFYLWAMGSGRARNQSEIDAMLVEAGFAPSRRLKTPVPLICSVLLTNPV